MSPEAQELLALMAQGWRVERDDGGYPELIQRMSFMEGNAGRFNAAVYELADAHLVDSAANGSGTCWINEAGRAASPQKDRGGSS